MRIIKYRLIVKGIFVVLLLISCTKHNDLPSLTKEAPATLGEIFDVFWTKMQTRYVYWDIDSTNWRRVYEHYKPLFSRLDIKDPYDVNMAFQYLKDMTSGLVDGHYSIRFNHPLLKDSLIYPALERIGEEKDFHYPFPYTVVDTSYLDQSYVRSYQAIPGEEPLIVISGRINGNILYFYCNKFKLSKAYHGNTLNNTIKSTLDRFFQDLNLSTIKGLIIDVRGNPGGDIIDHDFLIGKLTAAPVNWGYSRYKSQPGPLDFTPWLPAVLHPQSEHSINYPIIALADRYSISLSEAIAMIIHTLPGGYVIGERTWGATGPIADSPVFDSGSFDVGDFMSVETSTAAFKYIDQKSYENKGFPPDTLVEFNLKLLQQGKDRQLEAAISHILHN